MKNKVEKGVVKWIKKVDEKKVKGIKWMLIEKGYKEGVEKEIEERKKKIYVGKEWEKYKEEREENEEWIKKMEKEGIEKKELQKGGYMEEKVMIEKI